jgi:hypothetical protein
MNWIRSSSFEKGTVAIYPTLLRIIYNHYIILSSLSLIETVWPSKVDSLVNSTDSSITELSSTLFSVECLMGHSGLRPAYRRALIYMVIPLMMMLLCILVLKIYYKNN